jgi:hypothetical protein
MDFSQRRSGITRVTAAAVLGVIFVILAALFTEVGQAGGGGGVTPNSCSSGDYANGISDSAGTLVCAQVQLSQVGGSTTCPTGPPQEYAISLSDGSFTCATAGSSSGVSSIAQGSETPVSGDVVFVNSTSIGITISGQNVYFKINPATCSAGDYATAIGNSPELTCDQVLVPQIAGWTYATCPGGDFVYGNATTGFECSQVFGDQLADFAQVPCTTEVEVNASNSADFIGYDCATNAVEYGGTHNAGSVSGASAAAVINAGLGYDLSVLVAPGVYPLTTSVIIQNDSALLGSGWDTTVFEATANSESLITGGAQQTNHASVGGIELAPNGYTSVDGIMLAGTEGYTVNQITDIHFYNNFAIALDVDGNEDDLINNIFEEGQGQIYAHAEYGDMSLSYVYQAPVGSANLHVGAQKLSVVDSVLNGVVFDNQVSSVVTTYTALFQNDYLANTYDGPRFSSPSGDTVQDLMLLNDYIGLFDSQALFENSASATTWNVFQLNTQNCFIANEDSSSVVWVYNAAANPAVTYVNIGGGTTSTVNTASTFLWATNTVDGTIAAGSLENNGATTWNFAVGTYVPYNTVENFPAACSANYFISGLASTPTCTQVSYTGLTNFPAACSANEYVTTVGSTLTCAQPNFADLTNYPSLCSGSQFSQGVSASSNNCATPAGLPTQDYLSATQTIGSTTQPTKYIISATTGCDLSGSTTASKTCAFSSAAQVGDTIVVLVTCTSGSTNTGVCAGAVTAADVADTSGDTFNMATGCNTQYTTPSEGSTGIFYATAGHAVTQTITVSGFSSSVAHTVAIFAIELSGAYVPGKCQGQTATGTTVTAGSQAYVSTDTPFQVSDVVGINNEAVTSCTAGSGFTIVDYHAELACLQYETSSITSPTTWAMTIGSSSATWVTIGAVFWPGTVTTYSSTGLSVAISASTTYAFTVNMQINPLNSLATANFEIDTTALGSGSSVVLACVVSPGTSNQCVTASGTAILSAAMTTENTLTIWGTVTAGSSGGTLQIDVADLSGANAVLIIAGSNIVVTPASGET